MRSVFRLFWTVRYLSLRQVFFRARRIVRRRWQLATHAKAPQYANARLAKHAPLWENFTAPAVRNEQHEAAQAILKNEFTYLNSTAVFESGIGWHDANLSQLFRYHLHYFHYVLSLLVAHHDGNPRSYPTFKRIAQDWIESNRQLKGDGWHPYTLSLRIVNWLNAIAGFAEELDQDEAFKQELLGSLYGQCRYLASDLEHDVRGNQSFAGKYSCADLGWHCIERHRGRALVTNWAGCLKLPHGH